MIATLHWPRRWLIYFLVSVFLLLVIYTIVGERGAIHLWRLREEKFSLDQRIYQLQINNQSMRARITRLRSDAPYLEKTAREELNLVRPGEIIYRFPAPVQAEPRSRALADSPSQSPPSTGQIQHR